MKAVLRKAAATLTAMLLPIAAWAALVAVGPDFPGLMDPWRAAVDLTLLMVFAGAGFVVLAKTYPSRVVALACLYFPLMFLCMLYAGVLVEWRLDPGKF
jgi:hypothetical protein